jgi:hypothetical protein
LGLTATEVGPELAAKGIVWIHTGAAYAGVITGVAMNIASAAREITERLMFVFMIFQSVWD